MTQKHPFDLRERANQTNLLYYSLLFIGFLDFLLIILPNYLSSYQDKIILIPNLLFIGTAILCEKNKQTKQLLTLGATMVVWYIVTQLLHHFAGLRVRPMSVFVSVYLVALPFASTARDGEDAKGLKGYACLYAAGMIVIIGYACLVLIKRVPWFLEKYVFFWKNGIYLISHPSQMGGILLTGLFLVLAVLCAVNRIVYKVILTLGCILLFAVLSMTLCNTAIWVACVLLGAFVFLAFSRGRGVRVIAGLLVAAVVIAGAHQISKGIARWGWEQAMGSPMPEQFLKSQILTPESDVEIDGRRICPPQTMASAGYITFSKERLEAIRVFGEGHPIRISGKNNPATSLLALSFQLPRLNGRTPLWLKAFSAIKENPEVLIRGIDYTRFFMLDYDGTEMAHMHNSWFEVLTALGIPGLLVVVLITIVAFWHAFVILFRNEYELWKKCIALLVIGLMGIGAMEPHLFLGGHFLPGGNNLHPIDFTFFLSIGYMVEWRVLARNNRK